MPSMPAVRPTTVDEAAEPTVGDGLAMVRLEFLVAGSKGTPYEIVFERRGDNANAICTCEAGRNGLYCKHRFQLMSGEISNLLSENTIDVEKLRDLLRGTDLESAYERALRAEEVYVKAKAAFDAAKRALAKAMYR